MVILSAISIALGGLAVVLVARAIALPSIKTARALQALEAYSYDSAVAVVAEPERGPALGTLAARLGDLLSRRLSGVRPDGLRQEIMAAGLYSLAPATLLGYRVIGAVAVAAIGALAASGMSLVSGVALIGVAAAMGWLAPLTYVRRRARFRLMQIDRELPELIDLLVVTVEAGMGLAASLKLATTKLRGPLVDELKLVLQEQRMGRSLSDALIAMTARADTPAVRSFVRSLTQGETLGVSIGAIMRNLAGEMRRRRRHDAQERAQKAPVKMLFPLVFLIMPPFLLVVLGPALFSLLSGIALAD